MPIARLDDVEIHHEVQGQGAETLVLLNGVALTSEGWGLQLPDLSRQLRVVTFDFRGQGRSSKPEAPFYPIETQARDAVRLLDHLGIGSAHFLGLSYGGLVAQQIAVDFPDRVRKLVLSHTAAYADAVARAIYDSWDKAGALGGGALRFAMSLPLTFGARYIEARPDLISAFARMAEKSPWEPVRRLAEGTLRHDLRSRLPEVKAPTLVLASDEDRFMPLHHSRLLAELIPGARMEVLSGCGHAAPLEMPTEYNRIVLEFLSGTAAN